DDVRHDEGVGQLLATEGPGPVAVEVERADVNGTDQQWEAEDGARPRPHGRRRERRPSRRAGPGEIRLQRRSTPAPRLEAGALTKVELELLQGPADAVRDGKCPGSRVACRQHDADAAQPDDVEARVAQAARDDLTVGDVRFQVFD